MNNKTCALLRHMRNPVPSSKLQMFQVTGKDFNVPWAFANLIQRRVAEVMPFLMRDHEYSPAQLLGPDLWSALNSGEARMAVLAIADMAKRGEFALRVASRDCDGTAMRLTPHTRSVTSGAKP